MLLVETLYVLKNLLFVSRSVSLKLKVLQLTLEVLFLRCALAKCKLARSVVAWATPKTHPKRLIFILFIFWSKIATSVAVNFPRSFTFQNN